MLSENIFYYQNYNNLKKISLFSTATLKVAIQILKLIIKLNF